MANLKNSPCDNYVEKNTIAATYVTNIVLCCSFVAAIYHVTLCVVYTMISRKAKITLSKKMKKVLNKFITM